MDVTRVSHPVGGFPIEIETRISMLITYILAIFVHIIEIAKLFVIILLILVSISIGNPPRVGYACLLLEYGSILDGISQTAFIVWSRTS